MALKITIVERRTVEVAFIQLTMDVKGNTDIPLDYPRRWKDVWYITIDVDTGQIQHWPAGTAPRHLHLKVDDRGIYRVLNSAWCELAKIAPNCVPNCICGYFREYIDFDIDELGRIKNWSKIFDPDEVAADFWPTKP